jgi:hypothetical protein
MITKRSDFHNQHSTKGTLTGTYMWICAIALATLLAGPAWGGIFFSDLGSDSTVYNTVTGYAVAGSGSLELASYVSANSFETVAGGSVSQIDLAVSNFSGSNEFSASIWTDSSGMPGTMVSGASWGVTTAVSVGSCCDLTILPYISGVTLAPDTDYFMVLGPVILNDNSFNEWNWNTVGATGVNLYSENGGSWATPPSATTGAFEIIGTISEPGTIPEPATLTLFGLGLVGVGFMRRRKAA